MCFAAKADAVAALAALGIDQANLSVTREAPVWFHPGRSGALKLGPKVALGAFGELHPDVLRRSSAWMRRSRLSSFTSTPFRRPNANP